MTNQLNRRNFIKNTALVTGGIIAVPTIIPSCAKGANDKITLGMIGTGEHGTTWNMKHYFEVPDCRIVAVCDVDKGRMLYAKKITDEKYGDKSCKTYSDFRELLARKEIDAVQISTPDHWHVHQAIMAMQAGKDVSCEKPTWTIDLGRKLVNAIGKTDRVYAVSLEDRSLEPYYRMAMLVRNGHIGKITKMRTGLPGAYSTGSQGFRLGNVAWSGALLTVFARQNSFQFQVVRRLFGWKHCRLGRTYYRRCAVVQRHRKMGSG
jgi:predicted dehydrogenase